jgi:hypothetical protein
MALNLKAIYDYIPKFNGEREASESGENDAPITFRIKPMNMMEFQSYMVRLAGISDDQGMIAGKDLSALYTQTIEQHVIAVENFEISGEVIRDASIFTRHAGVPFDLIAEVQNAVVELSRVGEAAAKN